MSGDAAIHAETLWTRFAQQVDAVLGLAHLSHRPDELQEAVRRTAAAEGFADAPAFMQWVLQAPTAADRQHLLAAHFTVGETYFFREPEQLRVLAEHLLTPLIHARRAAGRRVLRVWCAGCSSGEEAYTLAIVLHRLLTDLAQWDLQLLATDLNPQALQRAEAGIYGAWSFRTLPPGIRDRYFEPAGPGRHRVIDDIRRLVRFDALNLLGDAYPAAQNGTAGCDVIFCRNVLLYFDAPARRRVIARLQQGLAPGGWLQVASAEQDPAGWDCLTPLRIGGVTFFQKPSADAPSATALLAAPPTSTQAAGSRKAEQVPAVAYRAAMTPTLAPAPMPAALHRAPAKTAPVMAREQAHTGAPRMAAVAAPAHLCEARAAADRGAHECALDALERALEEAPLDPVLHFVRATVLWARHQHEAALAALRQALFLDPGFVMARFTLGNLYRQQGDQALAVKQYRTADQALAARPPDEPVPEGEGLTAGQLRQLLASML